MTKAKKLSTAEMAELLDVIEKDLRGAGNEVRDKVKQICAALAQSECGSRSVSASIAVLKKYHEEGLNEAFLMPMAIGIVMGCKIGHIAGVSEVSSMGGKARAASLSKKRRKEIARNAAKAKWAKQKPKKEPVA